MARIAIFVMIPIVALLTWRDWVLERQIRMLAVYDAALREPIGERQIAAREDRIEDATWKLLNGEPTASLEAIDEAWRMSAPTPVPARAWRLASAARCALGEAAAQTPEWLAGDPRVRTFCKRARK